MADTIVVEVSNWHAITLPNRLWTNVAEREEFAGFIRKHASKALPDLPKSTVAMATGSGWLTIGAIAAAFDLFLLTNVAVSLLGFDVCPCAARRTIGFHVFALSMVVATIAAFILTKRGLERLKRSHPSLAMSITVAAISVLAAILLAAMAGHFPD